MAHLSQLLSDELERCRPWIEAALAEGLGTHEFDDIAAACCSGHMQLWPLANGCLVTEIKAYPRKKVLNVFLGGGDLHALVDMTDEITKWAKSKGCDIATVQGRKGWARVFGWQHAGTTIKRDL